MNKEAVIQNWIRSSIWSLFFDEPETWKKYMPGSRKDSRTWEALIEEPDQDIFRHAYDDLFKGTDASVSVPLWASVCKYAEGCLMDETTLKIVQLYHAWGYVPKGMDGNPPDYIGEMFRFTAYLYACALHDMEAVNKKDQDALETPDPEGYLKAADDFCSFYLLDTVRSVAADLKKYAKLPVFTKAAEEIISDTQLLMSGDWKKELPAAGKADRGMKEETGIKFPVCGYALEQGRGPVIADGEKQTIYTGGRNNCGGKCSIRTSVQDGCLTDLETGCHIGLPGLRACVRGRGYRKTYLSKDRLRYPMRRIGKRGEGKFERISWDEAADIIAKEWIRIRDTYGPGSRYVNYGLGLNAIIRPDMLIKRLLNEDGGYLGFYGSYSFACAQFTTPYIYGDANSGNSIEDLANTKLLILWAHNPSETVYSPQGNYMIAKAKENGAKVIVIDPRKSDTVIAVADEWIPIRPSSDAALAVSMAYVIWEEGLQDQHFMDTYCLGFDEKHMPDGVPAELNYHAYLFGETDGIVKTPEWAEKITGIPAETIRRIAREYATTKPACLLPGLGNQRTANGEQNVRAMAALACMTGNVGIPGGSAAGMGFTAEEEKPVYPMGKSDYPGVISCFLWTDAITRGHEMTARKDGVQGMERLESDVKMMFNLGSNTLINQHADINNSIRILQDKGLLEFLVCTDVFMTPSAKFADLLLPAPSFLEDNNMAAPWRMGHYLLSNNKVIEPLFECRTEYCWISDVAKRLGLWEAWSEGRETQEEWLEHLYEDLHAKHPEMPSYTEFKANGGYTWKDAKPYIAYEEQIRDFENHKFKTPSGKIEIFSKRLYELGNPEEIPAVPKYVSCPEGPEDPKREQYPLQLMGWHTKRRCHSIHDNNPWMEEIEPQRVWIHPADAAARGICTEDIVEVFNDRGMIRIPAKVTDRIIQGVIAIPEGAWYTPGSDGIDKRGSINVLTSTRPTPLAKGNPQHTNLADVRKAGL